MGEPTTTEKSLPVPAVNVTSGAESLLDNDTHVGVAIRVKSSGGPSVLMIPDVNGVKTGDQPVYMTKPIIFELQKFNKFLDKQAVKLPESLKRFLVGTSVTCKAFYYTANKDPLLMMFTLTFDDGLLATLMGETKGEGGISDLFDIEGVDARVFRCSEEKFPALQKYAAELQE